MIVPKDALTIYRSAEELEFLCGGRIDKVTMPDKDTLILLFHTSSFGNHRLLLSCNPSLPRVHITTYQYKNPETATGTLMYFRKRLVGAVLTKLERDREERIITFYFSALSELKERVEYVLYAELTGKAANIVFTENGIIGNCLRRVSAEAPGKRAVLIGLKYSLPNATGRVGITDHDGLIAAAGAFTGLSARAAINKCVAGLAPITVDEVFVSLDIDDSAPPSADVINKFISASEELYGGEINPCVSFDEDGKPIDFFIKPYKTCGGELRYYPTVNAAMDAYYSALFSASDFAAYVKPLKAAVKSAVTKNKKRLQEATQKLDESARCESDRLYGELITANIYRIKRGDKSVTVENYYDENKPVTIPLDETKTPQANAAAYFKSYSKKKKAAVYAQNAIDAANDILFTLEAISTELELCTEKQELDEVRAELVSLGLMRPDTKKKKKEKPIPSEPYKFDVEGVTLLVGKNHVQNDMITRKALRTEIWLHVKDAHGCHAVLKSENPTDSQIIRAAEIAAYYSSAKTSDHVAVDYTQIKFVYPHGGGRVDYKNYKTVFVTPKA
ncbi:MAG: NFACT family protein [Clostridiales bacterium]|nr:NFACT family protein [Clostridiales bacterium]